MTCAARSVAQAGAGAGDPGRAHAVMEAQTESESEIDAATEAAHAPAASEAVLVAVPGIVRLHWAERALQALHHVLEHGLCQQEECGMLFEPPLPASP